MKRNKTLQDRINSIPKDVDIYVNTSFEIVDRIHTLLEENGMEQKDLAKLLNKSESEISKWMSGTQNFTIKTLSKIHSVLSAPIIQVVPVFDVKQLENESQKELKVIKSTKKFEKVFNLNEKKTFSLSEKRASLV
jgi:transcriptional regulator with XRE-family HTH domain